MLESNQQPSLAATIFFYNVVSYRKLKRKYLAKSMIDVQLWEPINNIICMNELINLEIHVMLAPSTNYNQTLIE